MHMDFHFHILLLYFYTNANAFQRIMDLKNFGLFCRLMLFSCQTNLKRSL